MALDGSDVLKALIVVHPTHSGDQEHCAALRAALIDAGFVIVRDEARVFSRDTAVAIAPSDASAAHVKTLTGSVRLLVVARIEATATLNAFMDANESLAATCTWCRDDGGAASRLLALFPRMSVDPIPTNLAARDFVDTHLKAVLVKGLTQAAKVKPENPVKFVAEFLLNNNPNKPPVQSPSELQESS